MSVDGPSRRGEQAIHEVTSHGDGRVVRRLTVFCPVDKGTGSFEACGECGQATGYALVEDGQSVVICRRDLKNDPAAILPGSVGAFMSRDVECVHPSLLVRELMQLFQTRCRHGAPVVDSGNHLVGFVGQNDVARALQCGARLDGDEGPDTFDPEDRPRGPLRVGDIMSAAPVICDEKMPLTRVAELLIDKAVHRAPVVDGERRVVGIISTMDLATALAGRGL